MGRSGKTKIPSWFDTSLRATPVAVLVATTAAPSTTAWLVSPTVPRILPVACADNRPALRSIRPATNILCKLCVIQPSLKIFQLDSISKKACSIPSRGLLEILGLTEQGYCGDQRQQQARSWEAGTISNEL